MLPPDAAAAPHQRDCILTNVVPVHKMKTPAHLITRRRFFISTGAATLCARPGVRAESRQAGDAGCVVGDPAVEAVGTRILANGGNAVDALVATALAGAVTEAHQPATGGYAMDAIFAMDGGRRIAGIDGNSAAPAAFTADIFQP